MLFYLVILFTFVGIPLTIFVSDWLASRENPKTRIGCERIERIRLRAEGFILAFYIPTLLLLAYGFLMFVIESITKR